MTLQRAAILKSWFVILILCLLAMVAVACEPRSESQPLETPRHEMLSLFAAASLVDAFRGLGSRFQQANPDSEIVFNFAGSQELAQQIVQGAPAHIFASADQKQMEVAAAGGRIAADDIHLFAGNRLVVAVPARNPAQIASFRDLARAGVKLVLAHEAVPVGRYSRQFLRKVSVDSSTAVEFEQQVLANVVSYEQNSRAVLTKVMLGEADAGIVYVSDVAGVSTTEVGTVEIPESFNVYASYPIAVLRDGGEGETAQAFVQFVLSPAGQSILADYGFLPVQSGSE